MKKLFLLTLLLAPTVAFAGKAYQGPINNCKQVSAAIDAATMESSRSFEVDINAAGGNDTSNDHATYGLMSMFVALTDANTSITQLDVTCTVSNDGNATDFTPHVCDDVSDGVCTMTAAGVWQKASPGSSNFPIRMDIEGYPDVECTFAVGAGAGAAIDLLTVDYRLCVK